MLYLFEGGKEGIINLMVFNMVFVYENVKYFNIWISISRIKGKVILFFYLEIIKIRLF